MSNQLQNKKTPPEFLAMLQSEQSLTQIKKVLPPNLTAERFVRIVKTAWLSNPDLQRLEPASIMLAVIGLATIGLEPDRRKAYLIPFKGKAVGMPSYLGYLDRAKENGVTGIRVETVHFNDKFERPRLTQDGLTWSHEIDLEKDRGEMFMAYCAWKYQGENFIAQMHKTEIDRIRDGSPGKDQDPWRIHYNEMAKKTVIRRAQKQWPLDVKMQEVQASGAIVDQAEAIEVSSEIVEDDSSAELNPASKNLPEATPKETARQYVIRQLTKAGVAFDGFTATITAKNIAKDADTWASFDEVPEAIFEVLAGQPKTMEEIIKKFGKK